MTETAPQPAALGDQILPFQVERYGLRGRLVRLGPVAQEILTRHDYPEPVAMMLGQMMAVAASLAGALKYDGVFTLQTQSNGPIRLMVADVTSKGDMRAYAQFDAKQVADLDATGKAGDSVPQWLGVGHLAFTVDQGPDTERYQGIVDLFGMSLAECVRHYFKQSEQIDASLKLAVAHDEDGWRIGALMMQRVPKLGGLDEAGSQTSANLTPDSFDEAEREESWREAIVLMGSATGVELTSLDLPPDRLLYRLFHEQGVRVFTPHPLQSACRCSPARVSAMLVSFPKEEIETMKVNGRVEVKCEFCGRDYNYDQAALDRLFEESAAG